MKLAVARGRARARRVAGRLRRVAPAVRRRLRRAGSELGREPHRLGGARPERRRREPSRSPATYLGEAPARTANDVALRILALDALGRDTDALADRLERMRGPDGRIGTLVNSTIWGVLALRAAGRPAGTSVRYLLRAQRRERRLVVVPARRARLERHRRGDPGAAGGGRRPGRARSGERFAYLRRLQRQDGGFALVPGRAADAQSTAWAIQAFLAAGKDPGNAALRYLGQVCAARRQLPLLEAVRGHARLGHLAGAARARPEAVSAPLGSAAWRPGHRFDRHDRQRAPLRRHGQHERGLARAAARGARRRGDADGVAPRRDRPRSRSSSAPSPGGPTSSSSPAGSAGRRTTSRARRSRPPSRRRRTRWPISPSGSAPASRPTRSTRPAGRTSPPARARSRTRSAARRASSSATSTSCPGLPAEMKAMFATVTPELADGAADHARGGAIYETTEAKIVGVLEAMGDRYPGVLVGSYPKFHVGRARRSRSSSSRPTRPRSRPPSPGSSRPWPRQRARPTRPS